jgi:excisionase family DNA binding protein
VEGGAFILQEADSLSMHPRTFDPSVNPAPENGAPRLLTYEEAALRCGVSARTVRRWVSDGGLPVHRLPGAGARPISRISETDLESWLGSRRAVIDDREAPTLRLDGRRLIDPAWAQRPRQRRRRA